MLAEPKYKQKWADDPRNLNWSEDKGKYGFKMLSKMGWSEGKGLGANETGTVSHVKVTKRKQSLGLGASTFHEDNWIAHQDDFSALLSKLNQSGAKQSEESKQSSLQNDVKQSQRKIHYGKFIKSKDLSLKSKNDLACVFGQRSKSTPSTPQQLSEDEGENSDASTASCPVESHKSEHGFVTVKSQMNLQEYFEQRMAALKQRTESKANGDCVAAVEENVSPDESKKERKKNKKRKMVENNETGDDKIEGCGIEEIEEVKEKKNKKKARKETVDENVNAEGLEKLCNGKDMEIDDVPRKKVKKSKRTKNENLDENVNAEGLEKLRNELDPNTGQETGEEKVADEKSKKTKRSKKLKVDDDKVVIDEKAETQEILEQDDDLKDLIPKKKKKSKKTRTDDNAEEAKTEGNASADVIENVEGKKPKKEKKKSNRTDEMDKTEQQKLEIREQEGETGQGMKSSEEKRKKKRKNEPCAENDDLVNSDKKSKKKKKKKQ